VIPSNYNWGFSHARQSGDFSAIMFASYFSQTMFIEVDSGGVVLRSFDLSPTNTFFLGRTFMKLRNDDYFFAGGTTINSMYWAFHFVKTDSLLDSYCGRAPFTVQFQPVTLTDSTGFQQFPSSMTVSPVPLTDFDTLQESTQQFDPCDPTTIEEHQSILSNIQVAFMSDGLKLKFASTINATIEVFLYDGRGKLILEKDFHAAEGVNELVLNVPRLSNGIYLTGFKTQTETDFVKVMVVQ
jgi:hypothetical protein